MFYNSYIIIANHSECSIVNILHTFHIFYFIHIFFYILLQITNFLNAIKEL